MKKVYFKVLLVSLMLVSIMTSCSKNNTGKIDVTVENSLGYVEGAVVKLHQIDVGVVQTLKSDAKGKVKFKDVLQGTYYVSGEDVDDNDDSSDQFQLVAGKTKDIKLFLD